MIVRPEENLLLDFLDALIDQLLLLVVLLVSPHRRLCGRLELREGFGADCLAGTL